MYLHYARVKGLDRQRQRLEEAIFTGKYLLHVCLREDDKILNNNSRVPEWGSLDTIFSDEIILNTFLILFDSWCYPRSQDCGGLLVTIRIAELNPTAGMGFGDGDEDGDARHELIRVKGRLRFQLKSIHRSFQQRKPPHLN